MLKLEARNWLKIKHGLHGIQPKSDRAVSKASKVAASEDVATMQAVDTRRRVSGRVSGSVDGTRAVAQTHPYRQVSPENRLDVHTV